MAKKGLGGVPIVSSSAFIRLITTSELKVSETASHAKSTGKVFIAVSTRL